MQEIEIIKKINRHTKNYSVQTKRMRATNLEASSIKLILECESEILRLLRVNSNLRSKIKTMEKNQCICTTEKK